MRGAEAPEGKEAELPAGREAVEELSRHRAKSNLNFHHLTLMAMELSTPVRWGRSAQIWKIRDDMRSSPGLTAMGMVSLMRLNST